MRATTISRHFVIVVACILWSSLVARSQEFGGGNGEPNEPYLIYTVEQMNEIGLHPETWHRHFRLMADLDLTSHANETFHPIGAVSADLPFTGVFDGNGHVLSRFTYISVDGEQAGLFELVRGSDAVVKDLGLVDPNIDVPGGLGVGALVSHLYDGGTVLNCYVRGGSVRGRRAVGGLVGGTRRGHIVNCYAAATVFGDSLVGGLAGGDNDAGIVIQCYVAGTVLGNEDAGGLLGANAGIVFQCFWDTEVSGQPTSAGGVGRTTAQMQAESTYSAWTYADEGTWTIDEGNDYPRLWWEHKAGQIIPSTRLADLLEGSGTNDAPFLIYTAEQLNAVGLYPCEWGKHFRLMSDIDMSPFAATGFNPIGYYWDRVINRPFTGVFDGGAHVISNATYCCQRVGSPASPLISACNVGLFGYVTEPNAVIQDLGLFAPDIDGGSAENVGALVGCLAQGTITRCFARDGYVSGDESVGGLIGANLSGTVGECHAIMTVDANSGVGGLVGVNEGTVADCHVAGSVSGRWRIGGLVGHNRAATVNCHSMAVASGQSEVGGLVGNNQGAVTRSYSAGTASGNEDIGGLLGYNLGIVADSYSVAAVSGDTRVGGLVGHNSWRGPNTAVIRDCFSAGVVTGALSAGGLLGHNYRGEVLQSFWDVETSDQVASAGGVGKSTTEMQTASTFIPAGWDFDTVWMICERKDYPRLQWQNVQCDE